LPRELEWGQVLVNMVYAAVNPADTYSARLGGVYGDASVEAPFIMGHDGVGVVAKVSWGLGLVCKGRSLLDHSWYRFSSEFQYQWQTGAWYND
jgi:NADPH:quinone reductase-like Zn-dependent oxidoreductase